MASLLGVAEGVIALYVGPRFTAQGQGLRRRYGRRRCRLGIDQTVQKIEDVRLGRNAAYQRHFYSTQHGLFVVLQHQGQDLDHLAIAARPLEEMAL